jgi:hypothetical protein
VKNRREKEPAYPENWRRCRDCQAIVPLGADHDCQSTLSTEEAKRPQPDQATDD